MEHPDQMAKTQDTEQAIDFLDEASELINLCNQEVGPTKQYEDWTTKVEAYLGHQKAVTFTSRAGLGAFDTEHPWNHDLQALILTRQARLQQFIDELSR